MGFVEPSRATHLLMKKTKTKIKMLLGKFGWSYCQYCGEKLTFDEEKFEMGYRTYSKCPKCNNLSRFDVTL